MPKWLRLSPNCQKKIGASNNTPPPGGKRTRTFSPNQPIANDRFGVG